MNSPRHALPARNSSALSALFMLALFFAPSLAHAGTYALSVEEATVDVGGKAVKKMTINGGVPGPTLRFKEGEDATIVVTNKTGEPTSVHWHGILLPGMMDGSPGFNGFMGIKPGESFRYTFHIRQSGTYWYHSHSGTQDQSVFGAIVIEPKTPSRVRADRDYVVLLGDATPENSDDVLRNLKADSGYYNFSKRTAGDFFRDAKKDGLDATISDRLDWGEMRMDPTDLSDVTGYTFTANGKSPKANETLIFKKGERIRLRLINGSAMTLFDVRIPGLEMMVVASDGQDVAAVPVDELRMGVAERYDVIVTPKEDIPYTVFAESIDRTGYARVTLATSQGQEGPIPERRPRSILTMDDMGMSMPGMDHGSMPGMENGDMSGMDHSNMPGTDHSNMPGMKADDKKPASDTSQMDHSKMAGMDHSNMPGMKADDKKPASDMSQMEHSNMAGMDHSNMAGMSAPADAKDDMSGMSDMPGMDHGPAKGSIDGSGRPRGWGSGFPAGATVLGYDMLKSLTPNVDTGAPTRDITVRLTGNMERYMWSLNDAKFGDAAPIRVRYGERVRLKFINETMMAHPVHLHGQFFQLENGQTDRKPLKDTVIVPPGKTVSVVLTAKEVGAWPLHCHLLYHMVAGMMTRFIVEPPGVAANDLTPNNGTIAMSPHDESGNAMMKAMGHGGHQ